MGNILLTKSVAEATIAAYEIARKTNPGSTKQTICEIAGKTLGITGKALQTRIRAAHERYALTPAGGYPFGAGNTRPMPSSPLPVLPDLPDDDLPISETIETLCERFQRKNARQKAERWMRIRMQDDLPFALVFWGDPHLDNPGTNWPLLRQHAEIVRTTDGMYSVCVGDLVDNWVGRLMRLYAESDISVSTGWRLVRWFFQEAGLKWLITVLGNHDTWGQGGQVIREITRNVVHVADTDARFILEAPNGTEWPVWVRHDFPGHSMWNSVHGMQRAAHMKESAALYICGHLHNWALHEEESGSRGHVYWLARARGYKWLDAHQTALGHDAQEYGASIVAVCNPQAERLPQRMRCFPDVAEAADYLSFLRRRDGGDQSTTSKRPAGRVSRKREKNSGRRSSV